MLLQFGVENFRSYKDLALLSMEASSDKELPDNVVVEEGLRILKVATVFGANASGKSNLFYALSTAIMAIRSSNTMQVGQPITGIVPYMFDDESKSKPSKFEFVFVQRGIKYVYGFAATVAEVKQEYLYAYKTSRPTTIFERDESKEEVYRFTIPSIKSELEPISKRNTKNKLFLATATEWNSKETKEAFEFFTSGINTYDPQFELLLPQVGPMIENDEDLSTQIFIRNLLKAADINVNDFMIEAKEQPLEEVIAGLPPQIRAAILATTSDSGKNITYTINTVHEVDGKNYFLSIGDESEGTRNLFVMSPLFKRAFEKTGEVICIDEFDKSLHPALVQYLIDLFNDKEVNICNAQLIISTHTESLLSQEHMRRDQFYFVDKNQRTGVSELYSLDEFSPRKREDIRKAYLLGRYGAIPNIMEGLVY